MSNNFDNVKSPVVNTDIADTNSSLTPQSITPTLKEPSNYWKLFISALFAPWTKQISLVYGKNDAIKALIHMLGMAVIGWMALAWMFVERYHIYDFWHGDWDARARVYAYENNGEFMIYSILLVIVLMSILPICTQLFIAWKTHALNKAIIKEAFILHAFNASSFSLFFTPFVLSVSWFDPMSWHVPLTNVGQIIMFILFGLIMVYTYLIIVIRSKFQFKTRWRYAILHLWVPAALILLAILFYFF